MVALSCAAPEGASDGWRSPDGLRKLAAKEVATLLSGAELIYRVDQSLTADAMEGERFSADGAWTWLGGRVSMPGTYSVRSDGAVCVVAAHLQAPCRSVYVDDAGQVYLPAISRPPDTVMRVRVDR
jgi:hypothetical protein